jgi:ketosteroid isomerase-like protein
MFLRPSSALALLASLLAVPAYAPAAASDKQSAAQAERQIRMQRTVFNRAIASGSVRGIAPVLAEDAILVTGADSMIVSGKAAQLALWDEDLRRPKRRFYVRKPLRIRISAVAPMALETGEWRGFQMSAARNWAMGEYVAKWRRIDGTWKIESETYMAAACGGTFCPKRR